MAGIPDRRRPDRRLPDGHRGLVRLLLANAGVSLWLALYATLAQWTVYTGVVAYLLAGTLFTIEIAYRAWRFRDHRDGLADQVLRRIFPPRDLPGRSRRACRTWTQPPARRPTRSRSAGIGP